MKIAFVSIMAAFPWGGSEDLWATTAMYALNEGHHVLISVSDWSVDHPKIQALLERGAVLHARSRFSKPLKRSLATRIGNRLLTTLGIDVKKAVSPYQDILEFKPDLVCVSQGATFDLVFDAYLQKLLQQVRYSLICQLTYENGVMAYKHIQAARTVFRNAQQVFFVSEQNVRNAQRQIACKLDNAITVRNPLNLKSHTLIPFPMNTLLSFACVARIDCSYKGQDLLFQVLSEKKWKERYWQLNIYGKGQDEAYLKDLANFYGIIDRVKFYGHVESIEEVWSQNHIHLMPSINEGTPLALVEGMLCGRPAVVTDVGGNAEMITEGFSGFISESPSSKSFDKAMERAWASRGKWEEYGINAHTFIKNNYDLQPEKTLFDLLMKNK